jgi:hypothetical protein
MQLKVVCARSVPEVYDVVEMGKKCVARGSLALSSVLYTFSTYGTRKIYHFFPLIEEASKY